MRYHWLDAMEEFDMPGLDPALAVAQKAGLQAQAEQIEAAATPPILVGGYAGKDGPADDGLAIYLYARVAGRWCWWHRGGVCWVGEGSPVVVARLDRRLAEMGGG